MSSATRREARAARLAGTLAARADAVAAPALQRLAVRHPVLEGGMRITPAPAVDVTGGAHGVDSY